MFQSVLHVGLRHMSAWYAQARVHSTYSAGIFVAASLLNNAGQAEGTSVLYGTICVRLQGSCCFGPVGERVRRYPGRLGLHVRVGISYCLTRFRGQQIVAMEVIRVALTKTSWSCLGMIGSGLPKILTRPQSVHPRGALESDTIALVVGVGKHSRHRATYSRSGRFKLLRNSGDPSISELLQSSEP